MESINRGLKFCQRAPIALLIWTIVIQLFCNIDSYLYAQIGQFDSACFFMCGKALMNGMIPYTDFTDSKGVLLWFIYGIGYLFDHYSYVGVFWLACINVWVTLLISYKTAHLYLDEKASLLSAMLLMIPLMYWNFYTETKAEHFCWPAVSWGIYVMMKESSGSLVKKTHFFWLGIGLIACLMIKWSVALMLLSLIASCSWIAWKSASLRRSFIALSVGIVVASVPFVVYFSIMGNWRDMWQEYFVNTMSTVSAPISEIVSAYLNEWKGMFTTKRFLYLVYTLPALLLWNRSRWFTSSLPVLCGLFFIALSIRHDQFGHYISVVGPFAILTIVIGIKYCQKWNFHLRYICFGGLIAVVYVIWGTIHYSDSFCTKAGERFDKYMAVSRAMSQVDNPKIIIIGQERGLCMATSLPGTRYWITQMGCTEDMWKEQIEAVEAKTADFLILFDPHMFSYEDRIKEMGYFIFGECYAGKVYCKKDMQIAMLTEVYHNTFWDIISKKTYLNLYQ